MHSKFDGQSSSKQEIGNREEYTNSIKSFINFDFTIRMKGSSGDDKKYGCKETKSMEDFGDDLFSSSASIDKSTTFSSFFS